MVQTYDPEPVWDKPVDVPEKWIQHVDHNVAASQSARRQRNSGRPNSESDVHRTATRIASKGDFPPRSKLLDKNGENSDRASRWDPFVFLSQGLVLSPLRSFT